MGGFKVRDELFGWAICGKWCMGWGDRRVVWWKRVMEGEYWMVVFGCRGYIGESSLQMEYYMTVRIGDRERGNCGQVLTKGRC